MKGHKNDAVSCYLCIYHRLATNSIYSHMPNTEYSVGSLADWPNIRQNYSVSVW